MVEASKLICLTLFESILAGHKRDRKSNFVGCNWMKLYMYSKIRVFCIIRTPRLGPILILDNFSIKIG